MYRNLSGLKKERVSATILLPGREVAAGVPILSRVYFPSTFTDKWVGKLYDEDREVVSWLILIGKVSFSGYKITIN
jgi:hypothetical protein